MKVVMQEKTLKEEGLLLAVKGSAGRWPRVNACLKQNYNFFSRWHRGKVTCKGSTESVVEIALVDSGHLLLLPPWQVGTLMHEETAR